MYSLYRSKKLTKNVYKSLVDIVRVLKETNCKQRIKIKTIFMKTENSGTSEPHRFKFYLADNLILKI